jgi:hypothetical protein
LSFSLHQDIQTLFEFTPSAGNNAGESFFGTMTSFWPTEVCVYEFFLDEHALNPKGPPSMVPIKELVL